MDTTPNPGSSLYQALRCTPASHRAPLRLWLRWWHEVSRIPLEVSDAHVAEQKLSWWRDEVHRAFNGQAQHPLLLEYVAMAGMTPPHSWPELSLWVQQIEGLTQLVHQTRWLEDAALQRHNRMTTGAAAEGVAYILGASSLQARSVASLIGVGVRQSHQLTRLGLDARKGWVNVPINVLQTHDVKAHQISKPDALAIPSGWPGLLKHLTEQARASLEQGLEAAGNLPAADFSRLLPLRILAHIQLAQLDAVSRMGHRILHERVVLTPIRKWWLSELVRWGRLR